MQPHHIFEDQSQGFLGVDDVMEQHDVSVLQAFQKRCYRDEQTTTVNMKHMLSNSQIHAFISGIIRIQHKPSLSLTTYIQGMKKRLRHRKEIHGGFTAVNSLTHLPKHL